MKLFAVIFISLHFVTAPKPEPPTFDLDKIDTDDFKTLLLNDAYIDKSLLLVTGILEAGNYGGSIIIHRPEGWGKSTYLSMVDKFIQIEIDERGEARIPKETTNNKLFLGGYIRTSPKTLKKVNQLNICHYSAIVKFLGTRPVIFLKLKDITGDSYEEIREAIRKRIWSLFEQFSYTEYGDRERQKYNTYENYFIEGLYVLGKKLYNHFTKDIIILIDDYEAPLINAYLNFGDKPEEVEKVRQLLVEIYTATTEKNNKCRSTVIFMGVLDVVLSDPIRFKKEFKIPSYMNITTEYAFFTEEIDQIVNRSLNKVDLEEMKNWCCGSYDFFDQTLCQPRSSMRYLAQNGKQTYYQSNSSIGRLVDRILSSDDFQDVLQSLIPINASIYHRVHPENRTGRGIISLYPLDKISILHHCGYLRTLGENNFTITTNETRYLFRTKVLQWILKKFGASLPEFQSFANHLSSGNWTKFKFTMEKYLCNAASYIQRSEKEAQLICDGLRIALYHTLSSTHEVIFIKQNVEEKDLGFVHEILSMPKGSSNTSVIIKQQSDFKGTYLKSVTRPQRGKAALESLANDFYHERGIAFNIISSENKVNINVLVQRFTAKMDSVRPIFDNTHFYISFRLANLTDVCQYSSLKDVS